MAEGPMFRVRLMVDTNCLGRGILKGIAGFAQTQGNWIFAADLPFFGSDQVHPKPLDRRYVDGVIVVNTDQRVLDREIDTGIPAVVKGVSAPVPGYVNVISDNEAIGKLAFEYFRSLGFRSLAFCGFEFIQWSVDRRTAFEGCARDAGHDVHVHELSGIAHVDAPTDDHQPLTEWLRSLPKPVGILAANDNRAKDTLEACRAASLEVPGQVAVLGVDDNELICGFTHPPLSSMARFFEKAGFEAAATLNRLMTDPGAVCPNVIIEPDRVVVRQSTNTLALRNPVLRKSLLYIRSHADRPLSVEQVAEAVSVHPRWLYDRFRANLGHSVYDEITRVRVDRVTRLLLETRYAISDIAERLGFRDVDHFTRYFRRAKGETPRAFRKRYQTGLGQELS